MAVSREMTVDQRIEFYSQKVGNCKIWTGSTDKDGYAKLKFRGKTIRIGRHISVTPAAREKAVMRHKVRRVERQRAENAARLAAG